MGVVVGFGYGSHVCPVSDLGHLVEAKVYEGGIFSTLFLGDGAYGVSELAGGGLQTIVKQKGSAGSADPLDQRSSVGYTLAFVA